MIQWSYIGTNAAGTAALRNDAGIINQGALHTTIGGISARNVISGNGLGIDVSGAASTGLRIQGHYIGTTADPTSPLPNRSGIGLRTTSGAVIGGTAVGAANVIAFNTESSVGIASSASESLSRSSTTTMRRPRRRPKPHPRPQPRLWSRPLPRP